MDRRRGYTLLEMLLVLALVAVIAGLAWPALQRPFATQRLRTAADLVRGEWCQTRVEAMRSGHTYAFRYTPQSDQYCVAQEDEGDSATTTSMSDGAQGTSETSAASEDTASFGITKKLPDGVHFSDANTPTEPLPTPSANEGESDEIDLPWADPILFYPDGTTSDAQLLLVNERGYLMELTLRGLTGTVTTGDVATAAQ